VQSTWSRARVFLAFPPPPPLLLFSFNLPSRLADAADALSGMVNFDLLLLLLPRVMPRDGHLQCLEPLAHSPILFFVSSSACFFLTTARLLRGALSNICLAAIIADNVNDIHFLAKLWAVGSPCFAVRLSLNFGLFIRHSTPCSHEAKQGIPCTLESSEFFKPLLRSGKVQLLYTGAHTSASMTCLVKSSSRNLICSRLLACQAMHIDLFLTLHVRMPGEALGCPFSNRKKPDNCT
jgi:hypothetical protein